MGSASSLPSRSPRTIAEPIESRVSSGKWLSNFLLGSCILCVSPVVSCARGDVFRVYIRVGSVEVV